MFEKELAFFIDNQVELVSKYSGQVLLLKDAAVVGAYPTPLAADAAGKMRFGSGTYMLQPCEPGPGAYTVTISTQGVIA
jgi:hypothetical protein